jgi:hypothetical protein
MPTTTARPAPLCQIRVIGPTDHAGDLLAALAEHAQRLFGDSATYRTQTRSAHRIGHIRAYLTVTRKEVEDDHDG